MSSLDLRHITVKGEPGKADRLFRAAISAFCSLTRPSRREIDQLEDLALPLFDSVSIESRRFAAAALSECQHAPTALVRRLSGETVDIAAPLLIRSNALTDIDLIALIGSRGLPHARAIARRPGLNRTIEHLVKALMSSAAPDPDGAAHLDSSGPAFVSASNDETLLSQTNAEARSNADRVRSRLRSLMRPARQEILRDGDSKLVLTDADDFARLREAALTGDRTSFQTALAGRLGIGLALAKSLTEGGSYTGLAVALRALDLVEERAFLLTAALFPGAFTGAEAIRAFVDSYLSCRPDAALERVRVLEAAQSELRGKISAVAR